MTRTHLAMMAAGAFAVGAMLATAVPAAEWCLTRGGIPAFTRPANSVVRYVPFRDYSGDEIKALCGPAAMTCAIVMRAPLRIVTRIAGDRRAIGFTQKQCGQTPGGRACVAVVVVAPAGEVDAWGRRIDAECEADTEQHELAHVFMPDHWHRHGGRAWDAGR